MMHWKVKKGRAPTKANTKTSTNIMLHHSAALQVFTLCRTTGVGEGNPMDTLGETHMTQIDTDTVDGDAATVGDSTGETARHGGTGTNTQDTHMTEDTATAEGGTHKDRRSFSTRTVSRAYLSKYYDTKLLHLVWS